MAEKNRQWILARRPRGEVRESDFDLRVTPLEPLRDGEALGQARWFSFEAAMRVWITDAAGRAGGGERAPSRGYPFRVEVGDVMAGPAVVEVVESRHPDLVAGDLVRSAMFGWQEYVRIGPGTAVQKLDPALPVPMQLAVLVGNGPTAYFGMLDVGRVRAGETVVVSSAAGATGSLAAQIARIAGCRVVGIAGGEEKCRWLVDTCRLDAAIDYKRDDVATQLGELCPDEIDLYFDNVGGTTLEAAIDNMADHGRIVVCGQLASYDTATSVSGPRNLFELVMRRVRMQGYMLSDYIDRFDEARTALSGWATSGELRYHAEVHEGFDNAPHTFTRLYRGSGIGKQLLRL